MTRTPLTIALTLFALLLNGCAAQPVAQFPGAEWDTSEDPEELGFDASKLDVLTALVKAGNTQSMLVVKNGRAVFSYGDVALTEGTYIASVRKSLLSMLYGDWVQSDVIDLSSSLDQIEFDDIGGLSELERTATIRDLISARSGIYHAASNSSGVTEDGPSRYEYRPGEYYWYNNWDFNAAGAIFEQLTGANIYDAFNQQLAIPLQLQDYDLALHLEEGKSGNLSHSNFPAYHFFLSTRDLARLGLLMLHEGDWDGNQVVPANWVAESVSLVTPNEQMNPESTRESGFGYGYMWWVFDAAKFPAEFHGGYAGRGHFGQYIVVLPALDIVIAHQTLPVDYETPEEYEAINVTWDEFRVLIDALLNAID